MKSSKKRFYVFGLTLLSLFFFSCRNYGTEKIDLGTNILYKEAARNITFNQIKQSTNYIKLTQKSASKLSKLISSEQNYIWLKISFKIPDSLKNQDLGLCIPYLRSAGEFYLNDNYLGTVGKMPPKEFSTGFSSHYFLLQKALLNQEEENLIYIKIFPGLFSSISPDLFISETNLTHSISDRISFFNSKIILFFSGAMFLVFIFYFIIYLGLRKTNPSPEYMSFALLNFYTIHFLLPFSGTEIPFIANICNSYFTFIKLFIYSGAYFTIYFATLYILRFLKIERTKKEKTIQLILILFSVIITLFIPSYTSLIQFTPIISSFVILQFIYYVIPPIVRMLREKEQQKIVIKLFVAFSPVILALFFDIVVKFILKNTVMPYITIYGWQITIVVNLVFLVIQFNQTYSKNIILKDKLEDFNTNLEELISIRTKELSDANFVLQRGMEAVSNVQSNFLPPKERSFIGWDLSISYIPLSDNISGDLYDYYNTDNELNGFGLFDVSGHGIPAGLMTILAKGIISQNFLSGITNNFPTSKMMSKINEMYIHEKVNVENYITGLLFKVAKTNKDDSCSIEFANAGHPYPLFYNSKTKEITELKYKNPSLQYGMLGIEDLQVSFPSVIVNTNPNDIIICYTDGLTEATNSKDKEFGLNKLKTLILENASLEAGELQKAIINSYKNFTKKSVIHDDMTLIVLKRKKISDFIEEL